MCYCNIRGISLSVSGILYNNTGLQLKQGLGGLSAGNGFGVEDLCGVVASGLF